MRSNRNRSSMDWNGTGSKDYKTINQSSRNRKCGSWSGTILKQDRYRNRNRSYDKQHSIRIRKRIRRGCGNSGASINNSKNGKPGGTRLDCLLRAALRMNPSQLAYIRAMETTSLGSTETMEIYEEVG